MFFCFNSFRERVSKRTVCPHDNIPVPPCFSRHGMPYALIERHSSLTSPPAFYFPAAVLYFSPARLPMAGLLLLVRSNRAQSLFRECCQAGG